MDTDTITLTTLISVIIGHAISISIHIREMNKKFEWIQAEHWTPKFKCRRVRIYQYNRFLFFLRKTIPNRRHKRFFDIVLQPKG